MSINRVLEVRVLGRMVIGVILKTEGVFKPREPKFGPLKIRFKIKMSIIQVDISCKINV